MSFAVINAIARTTIRLRKFKRLYMDDYFLFLAVASLISGTTLSFYSHCYSAGFSNSFMTPQEELVVLSRLRYSEVQGLLLWSTIYCVKLSFMFYFKGLVNRLPKTTKWWWFVLLVIIPCAIGSISGGFINCRGLSISETSMKIFCGVEWFIG